MTPDIVIHGGGYVGLTGAVHWAMAGKQVLIYDPDEAVCAGINSGNPKAGEFLGYLGDHPEDFLRIKATTNFQDVVRAPVHVVAVPSEKDGAPYLSIVLNTLDRILRDDEHGCPAILVESTLAPGTLDKFLARTIGGGKVTGRMALEHGNFLLAACPRRDWFADPQKNLRNLPRVVGGVNPESTKLAVDLLSAVSTHILETDYRTAELTKPLENALLHLPVMMIQELAQVYPSHDVAEAVRLACTHWRLMDVYLGFGTGGRCVPLGPKYLLHGADGTPGLLHEAVLMDTAVREHVASCAYVWAHRVKDPPNRGTVAVLGLAYRPNFKDAGSSPGVDIARLLAAQHIPTVVHDPMWESDEVIEMVSGIAVQDAKAAVRISHVVLLATPHKEYSLLPMDNVWRKGQIVLDAQGTWNTPEIRERFQVLGVDYRQVGKPGWSA